MDVADDRRDAPDYGALVRRNWRPVVICTVAGAILAALALHATAARYTAHASVLVQPIAGASNNGAVVGGRTQQAVNLDTEAQLVRSTPVATRVQQLLHTSSTPSSLISKVAVSVPANSSVMVIAYTAHTPALAAAGAHDFAEAYLDQRTENAQNAVTVQSDQYDKQLKSLETQLRAVTNRLPTEPGNSGAHAFDARRAQSLSSQIGTLTGLKNQLTSTAIIPGSITTDSTPPKSPSGPSRPLYLATGVLMGFLLGLLFGVSRTALDKRLRTPRDVSDAGVEILASLPAGTPNNALFSTNAAAARAVQQMCSMTLYSVGRSSRIAVVGVGTQTSNVVSNLAVGLAQNEHQVVVVCAGSQARATAGLFGADRAEGLSDVLYEHARLGDVLQESRTYPGITVLTPGTDTESDPATGAGFARVLDELRHQFDVVVVQTPSADQAGDASGHIIAGMTDGALLVAELNQTRKDRWADALALLSRMSTPVIGAVTTGGGTRHRHASKDAPAARTNSRAARFTPSGAGVSGNLGAARRPSTPAVAPTTTPPEPPTAATEDEVSARDAARPAPGPAPAAPAARVDREPHDRPLPSGPSSSTSNGWPEPSPSGSSGDAPVGFPRP